MIAICTYYVLHPTYPTICWILVGVPTTYINILIIRATMPRYRMDSIVGLNWKTLILAIQMSVIFVLLCT